MTLSPELFILITVLPHTIHVTLDISKTIKVTPPSLCSLRVIFQRAIKTKPGWIQEEFQSTNNCFLPSLVREVQWWLQISDWKISSFHVHFVNSFKAMISLALSFCSLSSSSKWKRQEREMFFHVGLGMELRKLSEDVRIICGNRSLHYLSTSLDKAQKSSSSRQKGWLSPALGLRRRNHCSWKC